MAEGRRCEHCDREIEVCSFCDEESCGVCLCYACVTAELRERTPQPHSHGG